MSDKSSQHKNRVSPIESAPPSLISFLVHEIKKCDADDATGSRSRSREVGSILLDTLDTIVHEILDLSREIPT